VGDLIHSRVRRTLLLLVPGALFAQKSQLQPPVVQVPADPDDVRLPNGKKQKDEILKAEYEQNVKDAQDLAVIARAFEEDLEKDDRWVLSLSSLKKLDDIEKLTKRIRSRMKRY
jgi:cell division septation protein DedD